MLSETACEKCGELWGEYGTAIREHVALLRERERAAGVDGAQYADPARFTELEPRITPAADRREFAKRTIKVHLALEHLPIAEIATA